MIESAKLELNQAEVTLDIIREQAAYWLLENQTDNELTTKKFDTWLAESPLHGQVFEQMEGLWSAVNPQQQAQKRQKSRRRKQTQLGVASLCLGAVLLSQQLPWQYWHADHATAVGQVTTITLADGSTATLNTNSAINIDYQQGQRKVKLVRGEVFVNVQKPQHKQQHKHSQPRPFIVTTEFASAEALGTQYSVKVSDDNTQVTVFESSVRVSSRYDQTEAVLTKGQQAVVNQDQLIQTTVDLASAPDWSTQRLIFNQTPLVNVIERLNQYHPGVLTLLGNEQLKNRQFTGALPANDTQTAIELLAQTMQLNIHNISPYFVWLDSAN